jgi:serralysin
MPNVVTGTDAGETLSGTSGDDVISALGGDDTINLSAGHDSIDGGDGNDRISALGSALGLAAGARSYTISGNRFFDASGLVDTTFSNVERIALNDQTGGNVTLDASGFTGTLLSVTTNNGSHHLTGSAAGDTFTSFGGTAVIDAGGGSDRVILRVNPNLGAVVVSLSGGWTNFDQNGTQLLSARNVEIFNIFAGTSGALNVDASASDAQFVFSTTSSADTIIGSTGDNIFQVDASYTGTGDIFAGFGGADHYVFGGFNGIDGATIADLDNDDEIDLSTIAGAKSFIGAGPFTGVAGEYRYYAWQGETYVEADTNGDRVADRSLTIADGAFILGETAPGSNILHITGAPPAPNPGPDNVTGTNGDDIIETGAGNDVIDGGGGNDKIDAGADNDNVHGGTGADLIYGGDGDDTIDGGADNDRIYGGDGNDTIDGGAGQDTIDGEAGSDMLSATGGSGDWLFGGAGDDTLYASGGSFNMFGDGGEGSGEDGNDHLALVQGASNSWMQGGGGNDVIFASGTGTVIVGGDDGDDDITIQGFGSGSMNLGAGNDVLRLPSGLYTVNMDTGRDTVIMSTVAAGFITIIGFSAGEDGDRLDLSIYGVDPFGAGTLTMSRNGPDAIIDASGMRYVLQNVLGANLSAYNLGVPNPTYAPQGMTLDDPFASNPTIQHSAELVGADGNDLIRGYGGNDRLFGSGGNDRLEGGFDDDYLAGGTGNDSLDGGTGNDILDGGGGADTMAGGQGNDTYYVQDPGDVVVELAGDGNDRVLTSLSFALSGSQEVETLSASDLSATGALSLSGNAGNQTIVGNAGANVLTGGGGADDLVGLGGDDILIGNADAASSMEGGTGDDFYYVNRTGDSVTELAGQGNDRVYASVNFTLSVGQEIETLAAADASATTALVLTGNNFGQFISGNAGANTLIGGGGGDYLLGLGGDDILVGNADAASTLQGGTGDDWYYVYRTGDSIIEFSGEGSDRILSAVNYTLSAGQEIETLTAIDPTATNAIDLTGNALAQNIFGNAGANTLTGGGGADYLLGLSGDDILIGNADAASTLQGGTGNDTYYVTRTGDSIIEFAGEGSDRLITSMSYTLSAGQEIETLSAANQSGTAALDLTGNDYGQLIFGNNGGNTMSGNGGADQLAGFGGDDILLGGDGDDLLNGGAGHDVLNGGAGADLFVFADTLGGSNVDGIQDFATGADRILLDHGVFTGLAAGGLAASAFVLGTGAGDADDRIIYNQATGELWFDADGNGAGAAVLFATLAPSATLAASDFAVV